MAAPTYLNFDLQLTPAATGFRVRVLDSPAGQASADFVSPFSDAEVAAFAAQMLQPGNRQSSLFAKGMLRTMGAALFEAVFQGELYACLTRSLDAAERQGAGLRLRLRLTEAPALACLPWEYLFWASADRFLALSTASPLVHHLDLPQPVRPLTVSPPVTVLGLVAAPSDLPALEADKEWSKLTEALARLTASGEVKLVRLDNPTLLDLQSALRQEETHVLHFIGHGLFDPVAGEGRLAFCQANGQADFVSGQQLGQLLHNEQSLRLAVLNACEGARTSLDDPFVGIAQLLVQAGLPAVIAMQFALSDAAALTFAAEFYAALADGYPVDAALTEARVALATRQQGGEWGAARLFLRAGDGILWQKTAASSPSGTVERAAGQTLGMLPELMRLEAVRSQVAAFRADFQAASEQINLLGQYKGLHDLLHKLQFRCYNVILQEVPRFPQESLAIDNLLNYEVTLQDLVGELHATSSQTSIPASELGWIEDVVQAQAKLHEALSRLDPEALKRAVWLLKRTLALQPSCVNQRLNAAARALRLDALAEALASISAGLSSQGVEAEQVAQFASSVETLRALFTRLTALVDAHDRWQTVERILSRIEDVMVYDLDEVELSWPDVQAKVNVLCSGSNEEWVQLLNDDGGQVRTALTAQNPMLIQRYFRRYRQRAGNRFYQVDVMLKTLCEELRQVGEPLAVLLRLLG